MAQRNNNSRSSVTPTQSTIQEQGNIFFFYRPKVRSELVERIDDVKGFFVVLSPESKHPYHTLITYPNLGHLFYLSSRWMTGIGPIQ
jgi:hypothetical protein